MARVCSTCGSKPEPASTQCLACQLEGRTKERTRIQAGDAIMRRLAELCISQADLARLLGTSKPLVTQWCLGHRPVSLEMYPKLAAALEWTEDELAHWQPRPFRMPRRQPATCNCQCHVAREATG